MDAELWFKEWAEQYDGFPEDYLVLDVESTGIDTDTDLILQLGWCVVLNKKVAFNDGRVLNWLNCPFVDPSWVLRRAEETVRAMGARGLSVPYYWDKSVLSEGVKPVVALTDFLNLLSAARASGMIIVAHNGVRFDMPILENHIRKFLKIKYNFRPEEIWDTGALEKAVQLDEILCSGELPGDFAYRILNRSSDRVSWSLHNHALPKYDLVSRFGLDMTQSHTAPFDAYVTHLLFEEFRELANKGFKKSG